MTMSMTWWGGATVKSHLPTFVSHEGCCVWVVTKSHENWTTSTSKDVQVCFLFVWPGSCLGVWSVYHTLKIPRLPWPQSLHLFICCLQMLADVDVHMERSSLRMQKTFCCAKLERLKVAVKHAKCGIIKNWTGSLLQSPFIEHSDEVF